PVQPLRLALGQPGLHRERGLRQVQRVAIPGHSAPPAAKRKRPNVRRWGDRDRGATQLLGGLAHAASGSPSADSSPLPGGIPSEPTASRRTAPLRSAARGGSSAREVAPGSHRPRLAPALTRLLVPVSALARTVPRRR